MVSQEPCVWDDNPQKGDTTAILFPQATPYPAATPPEQPEQPVVTFEPESGYRDAYQGPFKHKQRRGIWDLVPQSVITIQPDASAGDIPIRSPEAANAVPSSTGEDGTVTTSRTVLLVLSFVFVFVLCSVADKSLELCREILLRHIAHCPLRVVCHCTPCPFGIVTILSLFT